MEATKTDEMQDYVCVLCPCAGQNNLERLFWLRRLGGVFPYYERTR